jgi:hypothetical protein
MGVKGNWVTGKPWQGSLRLQTMNQQHGSDRNNCHRLLVAALDCVHEESSWGQWSASKVCIGSRVCSTTRLPSCRVSSHQHKQNAAAGHAFEQSQLCNTHLADQPRSTPQTQCSSIHQYHTQLRISAQYGCWNSSMHALYMIPADLRSQQTLDMPERQAAAVCFTTSARISLQNSCVQVGN